MGVLELESDSSADDSSEKRQSKAESELWKALLTLSSGSLIFSFQHATSNPYMALVKKVFISISWACYLACIVMVVVSLYHYSLAYALQMNYKITQLMESADNYTNRMFKLFRFYHIMNKGALYLFTGGCLFLAFYGMSFLFDP